MATDASSVFDLEVFLPLLAELLYDNSLIKKENVRFDGKSTMEEETYWNYVKVKEPWKPTTPEQEQAIALYRAFGKCGDMCKIVHKVLNSIFFTHYGSYAPSHQLQYKGDIVKSIAIGRAVIIRSAVPYYNSNLLTYTLSEDNPGQVDENETEHEFHLLNSHSVIVMYLGHNKRICLDFTAAQFGLFDALENSSRHFVTVSILDGTLIPYARIVEWQDPMSDREWVKDKYNDLRERIQHMVMFLIYTRKNNEVVRTVAPIVWESNAHGTRTEFDFCVNILDTPPSSVPGELYRDTDCVMTDDKEEQRRKDNKIILKEILSTKTIILPYTVPSSDGTTHPATYQDVVTAVLSSRSAPL